MTLPASSLQLIAEATTGGSVSESFVIALIPAIITAILSGVVGHKMGKRQVQIVQPSKVTVDHEVELVSKNDLNLELTKIEKALDEIRERMDKERDVAREAQGKIHRRIDTLSEGTGKIVGSLDGLSENVDRLLDLALRRPRRQTGG